MKWIGLVVVGIIGVSVGLLRTWPLINVVETGRTPEYPDLIPRQYRATMAHVYDSALHAVNRMPRWSLVTSSEDKGEIHAESRTGLWRFIDDVVIRITKSDHTIFVNVRSASRLGQGDFGQNARNIRRFFKELDEQVLERSAH